MTTITPKTSDKPTVHKVWCRTNEEWRAKRANSIGASAVPIILGVSPFATPTELAKRMRDELQGIFLYDETFAMQRGHAYEAGVATLFSLYSGHEIIQATAAEYLVQRDDMPFLHASPDRIYWLYNNGPRHGAFSEDNKAVLECKTTRITVDPDQLPLSWYLQLQTQMGVTGYHSGAIACDQLHKAKRDAFVYNFYNFNEQLFNFIVEICRDFWNESIIKGAQPNPKYNPYFREQFPHLFDAATQKKLSLFQRLRRNKETADCLTPQSFKILKPDASTAEPNQHQDKPPVSLPEVENDNETKTQTSWISRIWN